MRIVNIMFSAIAGGIEQAFVDYCEALQGRGHEVIAFTHPKAVVNAQLATLGVRIISMRNLGEHDIFAIQRLRHHLRSIKPDVAITHTHRSFALARKADNGICPLVGITHNYFGRARRLRRADAVITITHDLVNFVKTLRVPEDRIYHVPNMIRCHELPKRGARNQPPVIGTMGRMVKKKGFDVYIDALKILKDSGHAFKAVLGGTGEEEKHLKRRASAAGLDDVLTFPGWVTNKKSFYNHIDLFCLPSLHEPFGIVLLEAFTHGAPVVTTDSEGPRDIVTPDVDALMVKMGDAAALAAAMVKLLDNQKLAADLAASAFAKAKSHYSIEGVAVQIENALTAVISKWQQGNR
jgi:glycosyltransferase involved in cell wall biosynthesis